MESPYLFSKLLGKSRVEKILGNKNIYENLAI